MFTNKEKKTLKTIHDTSLNVIDEVSYSNGAILSSPKDRRYPYVYPRDCVLIDRALLALEEHEKVRKNLEFLLTHQKETGEWAQRYDWRGNPASYKPPQLDCNGLVLHMVGEYYKATQDFDFVQKYWEELTRGAYFIEEHYIPDEQMLFSANSIHEWPPIEAGYDIWTNMTCYAGLGAVYKFSKMLGERNALWLKMRKRLRQGIDHELMVDGRYIKLNDHQVIEDADISELASYIVKIENANNIKVRKTVEKITQDLAINEGISRYLKTYGEPGRNNGGYGAYAVYTAWMAQYFTDVDEYKKAGDYTRWFIKYNQEGHLPEHVATKKEFMEWQKQAIHTGRYYKEGRKEEAERIMNSKEYKKHELAYWVSPLTLSHGEFLLLYEKLKEKQFV